jgi:hypothetical protein
MEHTAVNAETTQYCHVAGFKPLDAKIAPCKANAKTKTILLILNLPQIHSAIKTFLLIRYDLGPATGAVLIHNISPLLREV